MDEWASRAAGRQAGLAELSRTKKHFLIAKYLARYTKHLCICTAFLHVYVVCMLVSVRLWNFEDGGS